MEGCRMNADPLADPKLLDELAQYAPEPEPKKTNTNENGNGHHHDHHAAVELLTMNDALILDPANPMPSARKFMESFYLTDGIRTLHHQNGVFLAYDGSAYSEKDEPTVRADIWDWLDGAQCLQPAKSRDAQPELSPFKPTMPKVANVLDALRAVSNLPLSSSAPCWLENNPDFDPLKIVAFRNGLLYIPTRQLLPSTPHYFTLNGLQFPYDPDAPYPANWMDFLTQLWSGDSESIDTLQEFVGYLLVPDTRLQKILMLIGPKRAGKGTIGRIIRMLLGSRNVCTPMLANMNEQFGLSVLVGKTAAIVSDARISGRADTSAITERLLSISGEDPQTIPRKFLPDWNGILNARFMLMTNELPKIEDASGTLASRFIVLALTESFYGKEDHALLDKFIPELPGILLWALEGWDRLYARGRFIQPKSSLELIGQFEDLGSPIGAFVRDRCEIGPGFEIKQDHLYESWKSWCNESGRDHPGTVQTFGRNLQSFVPWLKVTRPRMLGVQVRFYAGIRLKSDKSEV
jgi:putative DNA primase/helicase